MKKILRTVDTSTLQRQESSSALKLNDVGEIIFKLKDNIAFDEFGKFQATGRFVLIDGYEVAGSGIILKSEQPSIDGTIFTNGEHTFRAEMFEEFYYDVEQRKIIQVAETQNKIYKIGDEIQTAGFSYEYPPYFDIILLNEAAFVKLRGAKVTSMGFLDNYGFEKVSHVNGWGLGLRASVHKG